MYPQLFKVFTILFQLIGLASSSMNVHCPTLTKRAFHFNSKNSLQIDFTLIFLLIQVQNLSKVPIASFVLHMILVLITRSSGYGEIHILRTLQLHPESSFSDPSSDRFPRNVQMLTLQCSAKFFTWINYIQIMLYETDIHESLNRKPNIRWLWFSQALKVRWWPYLMFE